MKLKQILLLLAAYLLPFAACHAVTTQKWEINSTDDFSRGKLTNLIANNAGEVSLGFGRQKLGEFGKEIWSSAVTPEGTVYFGTGSPATIYKVSQTGKAEAKKIFEAAGIAFTAMVSDSKGIVYAGTIADGKIYRVQGDDVKEFCKLPDAYVWALASDTQGNLFAATGPKGNVYRIDMKGTAEVWWTLPEANALSLALTREGSLFVGGSERGLLYRITERGKGAVAHEFAENEVKALAFSPDGKTLFIATNKRRTQRPREERKDKPAADGAVGALSQQIEGQGIGGEGVSEPPARISPVEARAVTQLSSALYMRTESGRVDKLVEDPDGSMLDLKTDGDDSVFLGMGGEGHVYRVRADKSWELLFDFDEQQAMTLAAHKGNLVFVGAGNVGSAYLIDAQKAKNGEWVSEVQDCEFSSAWGNLVWQARGKIQFSSRSGNTEVPDATWSSWSASMEASPAKILSPSARYLQLRAQWNNGSDAVLSDVSAYFLIQNQKPRVLNVDVDGSQTPPPQQQPQQPKPKDEKTEKSADTGTPAKQPDATPLQRPKPHSTFKRIRWQAEDADGDKLEFTLYYKLEDDQAWVSFPLTKPLDKPEYGWDTDSIPDGHYRVKVVASDRPSNPADDALTDEKISDMVIIDNARPAVTLKSFDAATGKVTGAATDNLNPIQFLEYSVDGGEWQYFAPADKIFDSVTETFEFALRDLKSGPHNVAVRAIDADGNVGVGRISVEVKK